MSRSVVMDEGGPFWRVVDTRGSARREGREIALQGCPFLYKVKMQTEVACYEGIIHDVVGKCKGYKKTWGHPGLDARIVGRRRFFAPLERHFRSKNHAYFI